VAGLAGIQGDVLLVANPISGHGRVGRRLDAVAKAVRSQGVTVDVLKTAGPGDARRAAEGFTGNIILSFGGDGTFNEVLNGADLERCALGAIPAGAGNVLAKELGMPLSPLDAVEALACGRVARFDLGICNGRRFISMIGAGIDAHVVNRVHERRKGCLTQLHYVPVLAGVGVRLVRWGIEVEVDGRLLVRDADMVCVGNAHSYGGPIEMTPMASPADGLLDVMALRVRGVGDMVGPTLGLFLRSLHACPGVRYGRGRSVRLRSARDGVPWQVDGDSGGLLPADIRCEPGRVRLLVPRAFRPRRENSLGCWGPDGVSCRSCDGPREKRVP